ncbi:FAD/NAD(P)-binding domain-containing protein [Ganoderma leucocontextum]|nr:FAD/NAD(P)-binding domain-containing protein [Ganoderma leucocontextum]
MVGAAFSRPPNSFQSNDALPTVDSFPLGEFSIDEYKPIKVVVIGAGFSGVIAGVRFPQKIPNVDLTIYEKNAGVGGTWFSNRYPGLACDIPSHSYQLTFEAKRDWSSYFAPGAEICKYIEDVAEKYKVMRYVKLSHEVTHATYDEQTGKWHLRVRRANPETGVFEDIEDVADVLVTAFGALSRWQMPDIPGIKDYKGILHHSAGFDPADKTWQEVVDGWKDKRVGIIGVGSSALQLVPALQPRVSRVVNYVRGKTWLAVPFGSMTFSSLLGREPQCKEDFNFSPEEIERLKTDDGYYKKFRWTVENDLNSVHPSTLRETDMQLMAQKIFRENMETKLAKKPWIAEKLMPDFPVACRRLTPGPGYLEALCENNVSAAAAFVFLRASVPEFSHILVAIIGQVDFVTAPIKRFTEHGIETEDGKQQQLDVVFCATGYDTTFQLPLKIVGRNGVELNERWKPHPVSYLSVAVDGFPNLFMSFGPNSGVGSGSLLALMEFEIMYAVQAAAKMQRERLKSIEVKAEALRDFDQYIDSYFPKTVYSENCRSWYKMNKSNGRIVGLWPGSTLHALRALRNPRWEDYNYEQADDIPNRMYWLGDGQTWNEKTMTGDRAWYLQEEYVDQPPVPED